MNDTINSSTAAGISEMIASAEFIAVYFAEVATLEDLATAGSDVAK